IATLVMVPWVLGAGCGAENQQACQPSDGAGGSCAECRAPFQTCGGVPGACETDTSSDSKHCGGCNQACPGADEGRGYCDNGRCAECPPLARDCNSSAADGCETEVGSDVDHCGGCANKCPDIKNGARACREGACAIRSCVAPFDDCN